MQAYRQAKIRLDFLIKYGKIEEYKRKNKSGETNGKK